MSIQTRTNAIQNEIVRLYCIFEINGRLQNPITQPSVDIVGVDGVTVITTINAQEETAGIWYADYFCPADMIVGEYYDRWSFQWSAQDPMTQLIFTFSLFSLDNYANFIAPAMTEKISDRVVQLLNDLQNDFIYEAMHIPIYWEQGMRIRQEDQNKRIKNYFHFKLDANTYSASQGAIYVSNNGTPFTIYQDLVNIPENSSSSSSSSSADSSSSDSDDSSSSTSSSADSSSSSSSSSSSTSSDSGESCSSESSPAAMFYPILTAVGTGCIPTAGALTKLSGNGSSIINYDSYTVDTSRFSTIYDFAYKNWNADPRPVVRLNNRIVDDGWYADYNGRLYFDELLTPEDSVNVKYQFSCFSTEELLGFLNFGLKLMNTIPPASVAYSSIAGMPSEWEAPVLLQGAITALKRLIFGLNWQEKAIIFARPDDPNAANQAIQNFKDLYADYSGLWDTASKDVKTRKLPDPGLLQYVTPEYTLPGGRSRWFRYLYKSGS